MNCNSCGKKMYKCPRCDRGVYKDGFSCKHCMGVGYICPNRGVHNSSGGCFVTTATCLSLNKGEDCEELTVFRNFRDNWLLKQRYGIQLIEEYYTYAPSIVNAINQRENYLDIYLRLWSVIIEPCFKLITNDKLLEASLHYQRHMLILKEEFLREKIENGHKGY